MPSKQNRRLLFAAVLFHLFGDPFVVKDTDADSGKDDDKRKVEFYL